MSFMQDEMDSILKDINRCKLFKQFLQQRKAEENLMFWIEVQLFKNVVETPESSLEQAAKAITENYLCEFSEYKLNLDQDLVVSVQAANVDRNIFDPVVDAVLRLLETSCLSKFKQYEQQEANEMATKKKKSPSLTRFFKKSTSKSSRESLQLEKVYNLP